MLKKIIPVRVDIKDDDELVRRLLAEKDTYYLNEEGRVCKVTVESDNDECFDPREYFENVSKFICRDDIDYRLGDKQLPLEETQEEYDRLKVREDVYLRVVYMYDHSGISFHFAPVDRWDTTQVGFMYVTRRDIIDNFGDEWADKWMDKAKEVIEYELKTYNDFCEGAVYGYNLSTRYEVKCVRDDGREWSDWDWEPADNCSGFFGRDLIENGLIGEIKAYAKDGKFFWYDYKEEDR